MNSGKYSAPLIDISCIVCHHTGDLLNGFIESVRKSESVNYEIIVMTSNEELSLKGIKGCLVFHHIGLPAAKRNAGARIARGKYLAFFDDDVTIDPLCLYHLKEPLALIENMSYPPHINPVMSYGRLWNMERRNRFDEAGGYLTWSGFIWSRAGQNEIDVGQYSKDEYIFAGKSASCMIRKDVFKKVGGFDEDFGILGEESDLSWRVWLYGYMVLYTPQATGYHAFNTKFKPKEKHYTVERVFKNGCRNYITMLIKNLGTKNLWRILPIHVCIWFFAGLAMILTLKIRQGLNIWSGIWYVITNYRSILAKRRVVQQRRNVIDDYIWPSIYRETPRGYYRQRFLRYITLGLHG